MPALENTGVDLGEVDVLASLVGRKVGVKTIPLLVVVVVFYPISGARALAPGPRRHRELGVPNGMPVGRGRRRVHVTIDVQVGVTVVGVVAVHLLIEIFMGLRTPAVVRVVAVTFWDEGGQSNYSFGKIVLLSFGNIIPRACIKRWDNLVRAWHR